MVMMNARVIQRCNRINGCFMVEAFVATGLGIIKMMETLRDRTRIDVGTNFTTSISYALSPLNILF